MVPATIVWRVARSAGCLKKLILVTVLVFLVPSKISAVIGPCSAFPGFAISLQYVGGDGQRSSTNSVLPNPLEVTVVYNTFCYTLVNPTVNVSFASVPPGAMGYSVGAVSYSTANGRYSASVTLGNTPGSYVLQVSCALNDAGLGISRTCTNTLQFTLTATGGMLSLTGLGDKQTGDVLKSLGQPLVVRVTDQAGSPPTSDVDINFSITQQPAGINQPALFLASGAPTVTVTVRAGTTDAAAQLSLGDSPGKYQVTASCRNQQCPPFVFSEFAACMLRSASFSWTQSQSHSVPNTYWGDNEYDHSYYFRPPLDAAFPSVSRTGTLEFVVGSTPQQFITLSPAQNNVSGLRDQLNQIPGIHAIVSPGTGKLSIYNTACIDGSSCSPRSDHSLTLCDGSCRTSPANLLVPKTLKMVGCAVTTLAMAVNYVNLDAIIILLPPGNTLSPINSDPAGLNDFMSKTLSLPTLGGQFTNEGDVDWDYTVSLLATNNGTSIPLSFNHIVSNDTSSLDTALCSDKLPVVAEVTHNAHPHFVLVTGNTGSGNMDGSEYAVADPAGDGAPGSLKDYGNQFEIRGEVKDPTDRSKLVISTDSYTTVLVVDSSGRRTGWDVASGTAVNEIPGSSYFEDAIADDSGNGNDEGVSRNVAIATPFTGTYHLTVTGALAGPSITSVTVYTQEGTAQLRTLLQTIAVPASHSEIEIQYDLSSGSRSSVLSRATFDSIEADINNILRLGLTEAETAHVLLGIIERAEEEVKEAETAEARRVLNRLKDVIEGETPKRIKKVGAQVLLEDVKSLLQQLPGCRSNELDDDNCGDRKENDGKNE
jgi:hypothetical protein